MAKIEMNYLSYSLRRTIDLTIIYPTCVCGEANDFYEKRKSYKELKEYPVLYLLHGMSGDHSTWCNYTSIVRYAEEHNIFVVMMSAEDKFYLNHGKFDLFYDFLNNELHEFIQESFPVSKRKEDTYIAGLSMGGYGALRHGLANPNKYQAIGAFSAPIHSKRINDFVDFTTDDICELLESILEQEKEIPPIYMAIGLDDDLLKDNEDFSELCKKSNVNYVYETYEGYEHEWALWDILILKFIKWIPRTDKYKGTKRKV